MKKIITLLVFFQIFNFSLKAQKFEMKINAGTNVSFVPDFNSTVFIANDGLIVPGLITPTNSVSPLLVSSSLSETKPRLGVFGDFEFGIKLNKKLKLSFVAGILQMRYTYNTNVNTEGTPVVDLKGLTEDYGNTSSLYVHFKPLNISYAFFKNKLELQFGIPVNILISSKSYNTVIIYTYPINNPSEKKVTRAYFEYSGEKNKILLGTNLKAAYKITGYLDIFVSGQYYLNSIYKSDESFFQFNGPILIKTGLSWTFCNCGKKN